MKFSSPPMALRRSRFETKIQKHTGSDGCWLFTGATDYKGYGMFAWQGKKTIRAHRAAYLI